jgi:aldehyde:ferredoxin oxidoreductase
MLVAEAPDFLAHILRLEIPNSNDRLIVPIIDTQDKRVVQNANLSLVEQFIMENCHVVDGEMILWAEFYERFNKSLEPMDAEKWSKRYTGYHLPDYHPRGRRKEDSHYVISNLSWAPKNPETPIKPKLVLRGEYCVPIEHQNGRQQKQNNEGSEKPTST